MAVGYHALCGSTTAMFLQGIGSGAVHLRLLTLPDPTNHELDGLVRVLWHERNVRVLALKDTEDLIGEGLADRWHLIEVQDDSLKLLKTRGVATGLGARDMDRTQSVELN